MRSASIFLLGFALAAAADVYRWTDDNGVVHYGDRPPTPTSKPVALPPIQTYRPSKTPVVPAPSDEEGASAAPPIFIAAPQADETVRDPEGKVPVSVRATVDPGEGLIYLLDGQPQNQSPTPSTAFLFEDVERGEHTVSAALIASDGRELARAAPVTFYMMPQGLLSPGKRK